MKTKKLTSIIVLVLIIAFAWVSYNTSLEQIRFSDKNYSYLGGMTWYRSLDKGFEVAQQENKPIVIYFWAIWCQYCAGFQAKTLGDPAIKTILEEDYVLVAMDLDVDRNVASKYGVSYPPYVLFLDRNDTVVNRIAGSVGPETFLPVVTQVRDQVRR